MYFAGFAVNGINNVNTATLERRFDLSSFQVAWITSVYDIVGAILSVLFGYSGMFVHKGRVLALGAATMGLG